MSTEQITQTPNQTCWPPLTVVAALGVIAASGVAGLGGGAADLLGAVRCRVHGACEMRGRGMVGVHSWPAIMPIQRSSGHTLPPSPNKPLTARCAASILAAGAIRVIAVAGVAADGATLL